MKNKISFFSIFFIVLTLFSSKCFAYEKELDSELSAAYSQANFYFSFEEEQDYTVTLMNSNGEIQTVSFSGKEGTVPVTDILEGPYHITISAPEEFNFSSSPRVEMIKGEIRSETDEIRVSSSVSNLKVWFEDGVLMSEWDDTGIGKVNIQITNPQTMEVVANASVSTNSFSTNLNSDIEKINFFIVPSQSSRIKGAGESYLINVVKKVPGEVFFSEETLFNSNIYSFDVNLYGNTTVIVKENNEELLNNLYNEVGRYTIEIPLNDTENNIRVYIVDEKQNFNSYSTIVTKDIIAPKFTINSIEEITKEDTVVINGIVTEVDEVYINDYPIEVNEKGQFSYTYVLEMGDNRISVKAVDDAGNEALNEYVVTKIKANYVPLYIAAALFVCMIGIFIYLKGNKGKPKKTDVKQKTGKEEPLQKKVEIPSKEKVKKAKTQPYKEKTIEPCDLIKKKKRNEIRSHLIVVASIGIALFMFLTNAIMVTEVMSGSMEPTLKTGNYAVYNQLAYKVKNVQRGDIVCFYMREQKKTFAKRVVGIAGDTVSFQDGYVLINGEKVTEEYIGEDIETNSIKEFVVPEGKVFLMGDNRENSNDSRFWNNPFVDERDIYGKYIGQIKKIF